MYTLYHFSSITPTGVFYHLLRHCLHQLSSTRVPTRALSRTLAPRSCTVVSTSELQRRKPCVVNAACRHSSLACQAFSVHGSGSKLRLLQARTRNWMQVIVSRSKWVDPWPNSHDQELCFQTVSRLDLCRFFRLQELSKVDSANQKSDLIWVGQVVVWPALFCLYIYIMYIHILYIRRPRQTQGGARQGIRQASLAAPAARAAAVAAAACSSGRISELARPSEARCFPPGRWFFQAVLLQQPQATEAVEKGCFSRISDDTLGSFLAWFWN